MKHPQYDLLIAIANGEQMQSTPFRIGSYEGVAFKECDASEALHILSSNSEQGSKRLRIKPKTIRIGDVEVPEPLRVAPEKNEPYWVVSHANGEIYKHTWDGRPVELLWLRLASIQATEQGAKDMLAALVKQLGGVL